MSITMIQKIIMKNGKKENLPKLNNAEIGFCHDTNEIFIGSKGENIEIAKKQYVDEVKDSLNTKIDNLPKVPLVVNDLTTGGADKVLSAEQGKVLGSQCTKIEEEIFKKEFEELKDLKWEDGVQTIEGFENNNSYSHVDINVKEGEIYYVTGYNFYKNLLYAVLDINGNVIKKVQESGSGESRLYENEKVEIPNKGVILRVNKREPVEGALFVPTVKKEIKIQVAVEKVENLENSINTTLFTKTNALVDISKIKSGKGIMTWVASANIDDQSTYLYDNKDRCYTEIYKVKAGDIYKSAFERKTQQGFVCMLFNENGEFLSVTQGLVTEITIVKDGYIIFDFPNKDLIPEAIVKVKNNKDFPFVEPFYHKNFSYVPYKEVEKPLDIIDKTGGYMAIFHDFGVIGDSLASGCMEGVDTKNNQYVYKDNLEYSWGKCISRATGCMNHQFSRGGQYLHDNNWFDEWKERVKATPCTAYIICIGFNDYNWLKEDISRLGSISDIKSNYLENPNTFYGQYGKMIQLLKEVQPKSKLFLCNMEWNNTDNSQINKVISDMVNRFDNAYLIDLYTYAHEPYWDVPNVYKTGLYHKNTLGYQRMAWNVMSYIDYIVRHNMEEFIDVQFIGTDYRIPRDEEMPKNLQ